ncbi:hypothetical protein HPB47_014581 [Ixodes persulcatus]|uniref:Uncharacterized protein n=1 Tax=Ixodes persulcatus TaxID=34615 RepID=A0AC60QVN5_IXOPE|nr:hypothetical protein HPB47_014581 [Ixodes persulcatus]
MADGENGGNEGGTIPPGVFYSARRSLRPRRTRLEDPDIMFAALGNGDISDADDEEDETDEASAVVDVADDDWANPQEPIPDGIGHKLFFDNYFTSLPALRVLLEKRIYAAGTIQKSRTEKCPLKTEKQLKKEGRGSSDYLVSSDGKIVITRRMDNRAVNLASNCVGVDDEDVVSRWSKADGDYISVKRPAVVKKYNESMGGVDKTDFLVSLYRTSIRSRKWTLRVIVHFFHLCVTNSWLEYRHHAQLRGISTKEQMDLLEFTLAVVESLAKACSLNLPRKRGRPSTSPLQALKRPNATTLRPVHDVSTTRLDTGLP